MIVTCVKSSKQTSAPPVPPKGNPQITHYNLQPPQDVDRERLPGTVAEQADLAPGQAAGGLEPAEEGRGTEGEGSGLEG